MGKDSESTARDRIIIVCTANICRSPMAEALLRHALNAEEPPLCDLRVESAGIAAVDGEPASVHSVKALKKVGIDIARHRSQPLTEEALDEAFAVFGMTRSHLQAIRAAAPETQARLHLFREFLPKAQDREIPDPYGMSLPEYETTRDAMVEAIPSIVAYLREQYPAGNADKK